MLNNVIGANAASAVAILIIFVSFTVLQQPLNFIHYCRHLDIYCNYFLQ
jgi:hypothetical protein